VPYTRPVVWSRSIEQIEDECRELVRAGHKEIVLTGVFLGAFGRETAVRRRWGDAPAALPTLIEHIAAIEGLWRVRLSSLEPGDVTDELLTVCRLAPNVAPHFHLPLQSGSRRILNRMNRKYTPGRFRRTIDRLMGAFDRPALTTDIIVGFPGETDTDFAETLAVARHAGFAKIHAFPFSAVEGTAAWKYRSEAPPPGVVKSRMAELAELEDQTAADYRRRFVGQEMEALVERAKHEQSHLEAMTDRYMTVRFRPPAEANLTGMVVTLRIDDLSAEGLDGTLVS
jgi:threonylcarbamoyladenosine tRNA methylthiotransferase MtaB